MNVLCFEENVHVTGGRRIRRAHFERRPALTLSAASVVANAVRETLAPLLRQTPGVRLFEPLAPAPNAWSILVSRSSVFRARGARTEAAFVLRPDDALALAASAFGEKAPAPRALSGCEHAVLERAMSALLPALAPLCGPDVRACTGSGTAFSAYFEIVIAASSTFRLGVAVAVDAAPAAAGTLRLADLEAVPVELTAELARGSISANDVLALRPGVLVPMMTKIGERGCLLLGGRVLARGACGALGERHAMLVE
ncbi:MAG: FliM/FliN family flagellar motor C-terminal domain-containing protein [Candidatus Baltobacteraceae bacterium]